MSTMTLNRTSPHGVSLRPAQRLATVHPLPTVALPTATLAAPARPVQGGVRLTRRGRLVVVVVALMFVLAAGVLFGAGSMATSESGEPAPTEIVMVDEGDTLWGIAAAIAEEGDVRAVMREIESLNALESSMVTLGQKLRVPLAE